MAGINRTNPNRPNLYPENMTSNSSYKSKFDNRNNVSKFAPKAGIVQDFDIIKSYSKSGNKFNPSAGFGRSIPKPNFESNNPNDVNSQMVKLKSAAINFRKNMAISPTKIITSPKEIEQTVYRSYASISGRGTESGLNVDNKNKPRESVMQVADLLQTAPLVNSANDIINQVQEGISGPENQPPEGFGSNSFSESYSQEAWIQYSGLIQDHLVRVESFIRAKAETLSSTLLVKMSNGSSPGGSPSSFQASVSGSISARSWKGSNGRFVNLIPGKDFTVQPQVVPGIAELNVPLKEHRDWLVGQYRFPYLKLSINTQGEVSHHGQSGFFYITQLRAPLQLYDIWGVDSEHFNQFDEPLEKMVKELCPEVSFNVVNVKSMVPSFNPENNSWHSVPVMGNKRLTIEAPPGNNFILPDGPYLLDIEGVGERVVYSQRVKALPECPYCGKRCFKDGCRERCKQCGLPFIEGHTESTCKYKDKGDKFASSNLWIEKTTRQALQFRTNLISYKQTPEEKVSTLKQRFDRNSVDRAILETQSRIMATATVPLHLRNDFEALSGDREDILIPSVEGSIERRDRAVLKQKKDKYTAQVRLTDHVMADNKKSSEEEKLKRQLQVIADNVKATEDEAKRRIELDEAVWNMQEEAGTGSSVKESIDQNVTANLVTHDETKQMETCDTEEINNTCLTTMIGDIKEIAENDNINVDPCIVLMPSLEHTEDSKSADGTTSEDKLSSTEKVVLTPLDLVSTPPISKPLTSEKVSEPNINLQTSEKVSEPNNNLQTSEKVSRKKKPKKRKGRSASDGDSVNALEKARKEAVKQAWESLSDKARALMESKTQEASETFDGGWTSSTDDEEGNLLKDNDVILASLKAADLSELLQQDHTAALEDVSQT